jgi:hypothetical protein
MGSEESFIKLDKLCSMRFMISAEPCYREIAGGISKTGSAFTVLL